MFLPPSRTFFLPLEKKSADAHGDSVVLLIGAHVLNQACQIQTDLQTVQGVSKQKK